MKKHTFTAVIQNTGGGGAIAITKNSEILEISEFCFMTQWISLLLYPRSFLIQCFPEMPPARVTPFEHF